MLRKLFEPRSIRKLVIVIIPLIIILLLTVITQYAVFFSVKTGTAMLWLLIIGLIIGIPLGFKFRLNKRRGIAIAVAVIIGFMLVPYSSFLFGQIHVFMKDDDVPEHIRALEVRTTIDRIVWNEKTAGDVTVFQGPKTLYLHPGEQRVHLGKLSIPAGTYTSGNVYIGNIEVDLEEDLAAAGVAPEDYEQVYQEIQQNIPEETTGWSRNGAIVRYTLKPQSEVDTMDMGEGFDYPGFGGPDITLDITLDTDGRPSGINVIFDTPPGISLPNFEVIR